MTMNSQQLRDEITRSRGGKGFDGWGRDPTNGALYLFVSRGRIRAKGLMWDGTGQS